MSTEQSSSRTALAAKASFYGLIARVVGLVVALVSRTIFIQVLNQYYLGVNGLYTNILTVLSLSELGIGSAMAFALYKPVAEGDDERACELLMLYRRAYHVVALIIFVAGLALVPALPLIIQNAEGLTATELRVYFILFLINTVISYFVSYRFGLLNALQRSYVRINIELAVSLACTVAQLAVLVVTSSFLAYLLSYTVMFALSRLVIARYLDARYPILAKRPARELPTSVRTTLFHEVRSLSIHQFSNVAVHATDSIIISALPTLGIAFVGLVSNYVSIITSVSNVLLVVVDSVTAGFGNLAATESARRFKQVFDEAHFIGFWMFGFCTACLFVLTPPFIELWIGSSYLIDPLSFALMVVNFYLQGQCSIYNNARIAKGSFNRDSGWSLAQALVNLVVSVACGLVMGLPGIYVGTIASRLVLFVSRPFVTSQLLFDCSPASYFKDALIYLIVVAGATAVCSLACAPVLSEVTIGSFLAALAICAVVPNALFAVLFCTSRRFKAVAGRVTGFLAGRQR